MLPGPPARAGPVDDVGIDPGPELCGSAGAADPRPGPDAGVAGAHPIGWVEPGSRDGRPAGRAPRQPPCPAEPVRRPRGLDRRGGHRDGFGPARDPHRRGRGGQDPFGPRGGRDSPMGVRRRSVVRRPRPLDRCGVARRAGAARSRGRRGTRPSCDRRPRRSPAHPGGPARPRQLRAAGPGLRGARRSPARRVPKLAVLATSREVLGLPGETTWRVQPLSTPDPDQVSSPDALAGFEAVELLVDRVRSVRPGYRVTNDEVRSVATICHRLDGIPLAAGVGRGPARVTGAVGGRDPDSTTASPFSPEAAGSRRPGSRRSVPWWSGATISSAPTNDLSSCACRCSAAASPSREPKPWPPRQQSIRPRVSTCSPTWRPDR